MNMRYMLSYVVALALIFTAGVWLECKLEQLDISRINNSIRIAACEVKAVFPQVKKYGTGEEVSSYLDGLEVDLIGILVPNPSNRHLSDKFGLQWQKWLWEKEAL